MANVGLSLDSTGFSDEGGRRSPIFLNWLGAILSVALISGFGIWGYQMAKRDVSNVPVVRAAAGPMRVAPENPGGEQAEHQGLAVNRVAAGGGVQAPADRLVLAPEPEDLTDEDRPRSELNPTDEGSEAHVVGPSNLAGQPDGNTIMVSDEDPILAAVLSAANPAVGTGLSPAGAEVGDDPIEIPENVLVRSPLPTPRPAVDLAAQSIARAVARSVEERSFEVDPSTLPAGTPLAQFGAHNSPETARSEWSRLQGRFPEFLRGRKWFVEETVSGGQSFFRLRATGFDSLNASKRFCSLFTTEGEDCIAVQTR